MSEKERILKLREELSRHIYLYHVLDKPEISDEAYDKLMSELIELEKKYPDMFDPNSPSQRIGGVVLDKFEKVKHEVRQWSFDNVFNYNELKNWEERNLNILQKENIFEKIDYVCELKIDGLKLILTYENGELIKAATRGDGVIGEDVTINARTIKTIPLKLKNKIDLIVVGECLILKKDFEKFNKEQKQKNAELYANPRNLAAGTLRQLDSKLVSQRKLQFFAYDIDKISKEKNILFTQIDELNYLKELGFVISPYFKLAKNLEEVEEIYKNLSIKRNDFDFGVDGMVIKINQRDIFEKLGYTAKSPRAGIAYKFPADQATTILESVSFQVGRTGAITPVANLKEVFVAGSVVKRATLHNQDEIQRLDIKIGDTIIIQKAGDIIPEVVAVIKSLRPKDAKEIVFPEKCPVCNFKLSKIKDSVAIFCLNPECEAKHIENLIHFVSKKAMNIDGLGDKIIEKFKELNLISDQASIYKLKVEDIKDLFGFGEKSANNIIDSINKSRVVKLENFIYALGIRHIGEVSAKLLAKYFKSFERFSKAKKEDLENIYGLGEESIYSILEYFNNSKNKNLLNNLLKEIKVLDYEDNLKSNKLDNQTFVITGTLTQSRDYYKRLIEENGGKVLDSVSSKLNYLLVGENPGSKLDKAKKLNIKILSEQEFLNML